jgi:hypothetical protein
MISDRVTSPIRQCSDHHEYKAPQKNLFTTGRMAGYGSKPTDRKSG